MMLGQQQKLYITASESILQVLRAYRFRKDISEKPYWNYFTLCIQTNNGEERFNKT